MRAARPDVWLGVDANQAFTVSSLGDLLPALVDARVLLILEGNDLEGGFEVGAGGE